ncbi:TPA: hypothetical protein NPN74_001602 [Klebsiella quasipneumoniae subsp. quasipneumoniae]|nr:hypothetical protein [Klebsiella quasipneumoniae subsp. quasipneumoniae]
MSDVIKITRWPTEAEAIADAHRVLKLVNFGDLPSITAYECEEKQGGGYGYIIAGGRVTLSCRAINRYKARFHGVDNHDRECDGITAEDAIEELRAELIQQYVTMRRAADILRKPECGRGEGERA